MPTAFKRYAVDFDGDGRRDVVGSVPDVIASTANHLKKAGWVAGQTWGYEVVLPQGFNFMNADPARKLTMPEWARLGVARASREPFPRPGDKAYLFVPAGARGPSFLMLENFRAIMKYNPAEAYALAIGHLADRLRGGGPIMQAWPRDERVLTPRRAARAAAAPQPPRLRRRRAERAARHQDPRRGTRLPGAKRPRAGRLRLGGDPGTAAGALSVSTFRRPSS